MKAPHNSLPSIAMVTSRHDGHRRTRDSHLLDDSHFPDGKVWQDLDPISPNFLSASAPCYAEIIGDPVAQSKSPLIHKYWLDYLGLVGDYRRCHVPPAGLEDYIAARREDPLWRGCNVTMPHKQALFDLVADPQGLRGTVGALNIITRKNIPADGEDGKDREDRADLCGYNSDMGGFLSPLAGENLADCKVLVIGAGGAARAIIAGLVASGCRSVTLLNRNRVKAAAVLAHFGLVDRGGVGLAERGTVPTQLLALDSPLPAVDILINASSLGMYGYPPLDIDLSPLPKSALVYDIVTSPLNTPLLQQARAEGLRHIDGLAMLIGQAALAFELFFHVKPPQDDQSLSRLRQLLLESIKESALG